MKVKPMSSSWLISKMHTSFVWLCLTSLVLMPAPSLTTAFLWPLSHRPSTVPPPKTFMGVLAHKLGILDFYANLFRGIHGVFVRPFQGLFSDDGGDDEAGDDDERIPDVDDGLRETIEEVTEMRCEANSLYGASFNGGITKGLPLDQDARRETSTLSSLGLFVMQAPNLATEALPDKFSRKPNTSKWRPVTQLITVTASYNASRPVGFLSHPPQPTTPNPVVSSTTPWPEVPPPATERPKFYFTSLEPPRSGGNLQETTTDHVIFYLPSKKKNAKKQLLNPTKKRQLRVTTLPPIFVSSLPPKRYHKVNAAHIKFYNIINLPKERAPRPRHHQPPISPKLRWKKQAQSLSFPTSVAPVLRQERPSTPAPSLANIVAKNPFLTTIQPRKQDIGGYEVLGQRPQVRRYQSDSQAPDSIGSESIATVVLPEHATAANRGEVVPLQGQQKGIKIYRQGRPFLRFQEESQRDKLLVNPRQKPEFLHNIVVFSTENPYPLVHFGYLYGALENENDSSNSSEVSTFGGPEPVYQAEDNPTTRLSPLVTQAEEAGDTTEIPTITTMTTVRNTRAPRLLKGIEGGKDVASGEEERSRKVNVASIIGENQATRFVFRFGKKGTIFLSYPERRPAV